MGLQASSIPLAIEPSVSHPGFSKKRTADVLCKAVLLQQARVEATRVVALKAQRELQLQQTKAVVAARGVKARVVRAATSTLLFLIILII